MSRALDLEKLLSEEGARIEFFQAVRLIECAHPELPRIGASARPADDPVRFGQDPSLSFRGNTIEDYTRPPNGGPPRMAVNFFGMLGPNGPAPLHISEYARDRLRNSADPTLVRFLDIFQHRMVSLFYRAWASAQPTVSQDRGNDNRFAMIVASLYGDGMNVLRERDAVPDTAKLHFAGLLACQSRNADSLRSILAKFLGLPVRIEQFVGAWLELSPEIRSRLAGPHGGDVLGMSVVLGSKVWDTQHKFRIVIGPLGLRDYRRMLPGGDSLRRVTDWVRNYVGDAMCWELQLILRKEEVPPLQLGVGAQLGWTSWCPDSRPPRDRDDLKLQSTAFAMGVA
jgi:type VI secretion system protein ImpH